MCQNLPAPASRRTPRRRGAVLVEVALIGPVAFLLLFGLILGGIAVFRCHQLTALANEGARWACVRGPKYAKETGRPVPTEEEVFEAAIRPRAASFPEGQLQYQVAWNADKTTIRVSLRYDWLPGALRTRYRLSGEAEMPVAQ